MNFFFPDRRALCMAENATHNLHNILTLRGAVVRDARMWSRYLNDAIRLFDADVSFASHHWPTWGGERIRTYLSQQRDLYAYLHDQTVRLLNRGYTGPEIAEMLEMPPALNSAWHTHGYYGSVSHNVKAIYQRYLGWFDGNPAHLWQHPPVEAAKRYVGCMGGVAAVVDRARSYVHDGDLRFAAELLNHAVFAQPDDQDARSLLGQVYEDLGFGAENGTWRNFYLSGAQELRHGVGSPVSSGARAGMTGALTIEQLFDSIAMRIDGPKAWSETLTIDWVFTDQDRRHRMTLSSGALHHWVETAAGDGADLTITLTKQQLLAMLSGGRPDGVETAGDVGTIPRLLALLDAPDPNFAIVTP
jgi:alkyl sulfatase BDS1-like metallo-beta-lactamase superfamily hydrolase